MQCIQSPPSSMVPEDRKLLDRFSELYDKAEVCVCVCGGGAHVYPCVHLQIAKALAFHAILIFLTLLQHSKASH